MPTAKARRTKVDQDDQSEQDLLEVFAWKARDFRSQEWTLSRDTLDESQQLEEEFSKIGSFVKDKSNANVFLMDKSLPDSEVDPIEELVDLRLVHRVKTSVTVADRPGKKFEAFMLDVSQYTASRKRRELEIIEFWRADATDSIRRVGLIYKEYVNGQVVTKNRSAPPLA